jgi:hypothetical protein
MIISIVNNKLNRIYKKPVMASYEVLLWHWFGRAQKNYDIRKLCFQDKTWKWDLSETNESSLLQLLNLSKQPYATSQYRVFLNICIYHVAVGIKNKL